MRKGEIVSPLVRIVEMSEIANIQLAPIWLEHDWLVRVLQMRSTTGISLDEEKCISAISYEDIKNTEITKEIKILYSYPIFKKKAARKNVVEVYCLLEVPIWLPKQTIHADIQYIISHNKCLSANALFSLICRRPSTKKGEPRVTTVLYNLRISTVAVKGNIRK